MEKLEIKLLSGYLPFGLKLEIDHGWRKEIRSFQLDIGHDFGLHMSLGKVKPILRPLSDLIEPIIHNGEKITVMDDNENSYFDYSEVSFETNNGIETISTTTDYRSFQILLELKFDVFGLIDKGLAVSVHDLPENPYK